MSIELNNALNKVSALEYELMMKKMEVTKLQLKIRKLESKLKEAKNERDSSNSV